MKMKLRERRLVKAMVLQLNRSKKLEGKDGFYNGWPVVTKFIRFPAIAAARVRY